MMKKTGIVIILLFVLLFSACVHPSSVTSDQATKIPTTPSPTAEITSSPSPTPSPTPRPPLDVLRWIEPHEAPIFTDADMGFGPIHLDMERSEVLRILGEPLETEYPEDNARGYDFLTDHYENGDIYGYLMHNNKYDLYHAVQVSGMWEGPRSLAIGDSAKDVLSTFYCQFDDWVVGENDRFVILYGLYPPYHFSGYPVAPSGYITEPGDYFLGWEHYKDENAYQIRYEYCSPDNPGYQKVLLGELEYIGIWNYFLEFTIRNDRIFAIEWGWSLDRA